jgi:putative hydrolase of the HAD superfamily
MRARVVFFDWGGTLVHLIGDPGSRGEIWARLAHELGVGDLSPPKVEEVLERVDPVWSPRIYSYRGRTGEFFRQYHLRVMDELGIRTGRKELDRRLNQFFDDPQNQQPYPEVEEVLRTLREQGLHLGVISNNHEGLPLQVRYHGLDRYLSTVVYTQEVGAEKPDARVFEFAVRRAGCSASEAVHVGNTFEADYVGATRAGLRGIWLNREGELPPAPCEQVPDLRGVRGLLR